MQSCFSFISGSKRFCKLVRFFAFNQIHAPKEVAPLVDAAHNHQSTPEQQKPYTDRANAWLAALVKGQEPTILDRTGATR